MDNQPICKSHVTDQRGSLWEEKMTVNQERFRKHYNEVINNAVEQQLNGKGIGDITGDGHLIVEIDPMTIPNLRPDLSSASSESVIPGNNVFHKGDKFPKQGGEGDGSGQPGDKDGDGNQAGRGKGNGKIRIPLTKEEWISHVFKDLELPNAVVKLLASSEELHLEQHGFSSVGPPHLLDMKRTILRSDGRMQIIEQQIEDDIAKEKEKLLVQEAIITDEEASGRKNSLRRKEAEAKRIVHLKRIQELEKELGIVPEFDKMDLRYRFHEMVPTPITEAVVFFHLDVSGSMGDAEKKLALQLFRFEYQFLKRLYRKVHIVLIHYHGEAYECKSVDEFFSVFGTGGTVYSTGLTLHQIIQEKEYPADRYNIYVTHCSDGDNISDDREATLQLMKEAVLPRTQYYVYVQIGNPREDTELWRICRLMKKTFSQVAIAAVTKPSDILPVFRGLFKKKGVKVK